MFNIARTGARNRGLEFSITKEDIKIQERCPYLNIELTNIQGKGKVKSNISLDRIDNSKGYIPGNVQVISYLANIMKNNATEEELVTFGRNCIRLHSRAESDLSPSE